jgi:hypothetical protein
MAIRLLKYHLSELVNVALFDVHDAENDFA